MTYESVYIPYIRYLICHLLIWFDWKFLFLVLIYFVYRYDLIFLLPDYDWASISRVADQYDISEINKMFSDKRVN